MEPVWFTIQTLLTTYVLRIAGVLVLLFIAFKVAALVQKLVLGSLEKRDIDATVARFLAVVVRWLVIVLSVIAALGVFGVQTTSFAAAIAAAGFAVGLAFQGSLSNFAAGVMLLVFRPFKVGDFVEVAGQLGGVVEISLLTVILDTPDKRRIIVPNSAVLGAVIVNNTFHPQRRVDLNVGVGYGADLDKTRAVLLDAAKGVTDILEDPAPVVLLGELADSAVVWRVRVWVETGNYWPVLERLTVAVKKSLDEADIEIPFPQLSVHMETTPNE